MTKSAASAKYIPSYLNYGKLYSSSPEIEIDGMRVLGFGQEIICNEVLHRVIYGINKNDEIYSFHRSKESLQPLFDQLSKNNGLRAKKVHNYDYYSESCDGQRSLREIITMYFGVMPHYPSLMAMIIEFFDHDRCQYLEMEMEKKFTKLVNPPTHEQLGSKLFAVHATKYFPKNGRISLAAPYANNNFRPKLYFTLGTLVESHGSGSWEKSKFAIIIQFKHLIPRLVNVFARDSSIIGDFDLPPDAIIVAEKNALPLDITTQNIPQKIIYFDEN